MTAERILGFLRERHSDQEWAFFTELAASGTNESRYMDAFALHLWQSKKFRRIAYEIKVSRGDLMGELDREPEKRAAAMKVSNQFFYVTPSGLMTKSELPEGCGLIEAHKSGLRIKVAAKYREISEPSFPFVARMIQRMQGYDRAPVPCFKYAGREMTEQEFRELIVESMDAEKDIQIRDRVHKGIEDWKKTNEVALIIRYLQKEMGNVWSGTDLKELKEWVEGIRTGVPIKELEWASHTMEDLKKTLDRILARIPKEEGEDGDEGEEGEADPVLAGDDSGDSGGPKDADAAGDPPAAGAPGERRDLDAPQDIS